MPSPSLGGRGRRAGRHMPRSAATREPGDEPARASVGRDARGEVTSGARIARLARDARGDQQTAPSRPRADVAMRPACPHRYPQARAAAAGRAPHEGDIMARAMWRGAIQFGLVTIPVKLYLATEPRGGLSFNLLHEDDLQRIQMKAHCPEHGEISPLGHRPRLRVVQGPVRRHRGGGLRGRAPQDRALDRDRAVRRGRARAARVAVREAGLLPRARGGRHARRSRCCARCSSTASSRRSARSCSRTASSSRRSTRSARR